MPRKSDATKTGVNVKNAAKRTMARSTTATSFVTEDNLLEEEQEMDQDEGEPGGSAEDLGVLSILRDYQKRKAKKEASRSAALRLQKNTLFADARQKGNNLVKFGTKHIEDARATIIAIKNQEVTYESQCKDLTPLLEANDKSFQALLSFYSSAIDDLFPRRAQKIDEASAILQLLPGERKKSYRRIMRDVRAHLNERLAEEKTATDATALIKHYQALLLS